MKQKSQISALLVGVGRKIDSSMFFISWVFSIGYGQGWVIFINFPLIPTCYNPV